MRMDEGIQCYNNRSGQNGNLAAMANVLNGLRDAEHRVTGIKGTGSQG